MRVLICSSCCFLTSALVAVTAYASQPDALALPDALGRPAFAEPIRITDVRPDLNPYFDSFSAFDHWVLANHVPAGSDVAVLRSAPGPPPSPELAWFSHFLWVSADGTVLPTYEYSLRGRSPSSEPLEDALHHSWTNQPYRLHAAGWIDRATYEDMWRQKYRARAELYPPIPEWLGTNPPVAAWLLPNGEVLTQGELGSGAEHGLHFVGDKPWALMLRGSRGEAAAFADVFGAPQKQPYLRFAADGRLLERYETGSFGPALPWRDLYFPAHSELYAQAYREGRFLRTAGSYFVEVAREQPYGPILAVYDFDGTPLPRDPLPAPRPGYCRRLITGMLELLYEAQQQQ